MSNLIREALEAAREALGPNGTLADMRKANEVILRALASLDVPIIRPSTGEGARGETPETDAFRVQIGMKKTEFGWAHTEIPSSDALPKAIALMESIELRLRAEKKSANNWYIKAMQTPPPPVQANGLPDGWAQPIGDLLSQALAEEDHIGGLSTQTIGAMQSWVHRLSALPVQADRAGVGEDAFENWWDSRGKFIDPDSDEVPWYDKRKGLAEEAFRAALRSTARGEGEGALETESEKAWREAFHCPKCGSVGFRPNPKTGGCGWVKCEGIAAAKCKNPRCEAGMIYNHSTWGPENWKCPDCKGLGYLPAAPAPEQGKGDGNA